MPYERQACGLGLVVDAVVAAGAGGLGQQTLAFVVPDGFDRGVGEDGQFADFHGIAFQIRAGACRNGMVHCRGLTL